MLLIVVIYSFKYSPDYILKFPYNTNLNGIVICIAVFIVFLIYYFSTGVYAYDVIYN